MALNTNVLRNKTSLLLVPAFILMLVGFFIPLTKIAQWSLSIEAYQAIFSEGSPYLQIMLTTFKLSITVALLSVLLAYPVAYYLSTCRPLKQKILLILILTPLWVSVLIRTYGWIVVLGRSGLINAILMGSGLTDEPLQLLYSRFAVYVAMIQVLLPIAILMLYSAMTSISDTYVKAARILGASWFKAFKHVFLPLTVNAIVASTILLFVLALGFFITPALVGGPKDVLISNIIQTQVNETMEWEMAAALSVVLLIAGIAVVTSIAVLMRKYASVSATGGVK